MLRLKKIASNINWVSNLVGFFTQPNTKEFELRNGIQINQMSYVNHPQ